MKTIHLTGALVIVFSSTVLVTAGVAPQLYQDVRILSSDESGVTFEYIPDFFPPRTFSGSQGTFLDFNFYGGVSLTLDQAGRPNLRYRTLLLGLPSEKGISVEVIGSEYEDIRGVSVVPVPRVTEDDSGFGGVRNYEQDPQTYNLHEFIPAAIAQLGTIGYSRNALVGTVLLYPVKFNPGERVVRRYRKIVVRVNFGPAGARVGKPVEDEFLRASILNYDVARQWHREPSRLQKSEVINSVLASGDWYRISVVSDGIYRLDANALSAAGVNLAQIDPRTIKIYGNGGREVPEDLNSPRPIDLVQNAIQVLGESDGRFDVGDQVIFYGKGVRGWEYKPGEKTFSHYIHHYVDTNYYWLTYGGAQGLRMASLPSLNEPGAFAPRSTVGKLFIEEEKNKTRVNSGREWYGQYFDAVKDNLAVIPNRLDGLITSDPIHYRFVFLSRSNAFATFRVEDSGVQLGSVQIPPTDISSIVYYEAIKSDVVSFQRPGNLTNNQSTLRITYEATGSVAEGYLDWLEILYSRNFQAVNDLLNFTSPDTNAVIQYDLGNFSTSSISVYDVTDPYNVKVISGANISGGSVRFQARQNAGGVSEYYAVGPNGYKTPTGIRKMGNSNVHGFADGAEFVIITHSDFLTQAQRLKSHREQPGPDRLTTVVVNVQDIFNEFSGGLLDPTAIRDYLRYAYDNWKVKPRYVLLLGDGDYDYKNVIAQDKNWIPPYETIETLYKINTYCTDDYYAEIVGNDPIIDLAIGRIPVRTPQEAQIVVDKIIAYETNADFDPWKNRITFVADDGLTSTGDDGPIHTAQAEELAERFTPAEFEKEKIYLIEYPTVQTSGGRTKPDAAKAIVDRINRGSLIVNWTGHGNNQVWAHEGVFRRETTIPLLTNKDRLTFIGAATCDFARYDKPDEQSATELLLVKENGGTIATLSSARAVYSFDNAEFNNVFFTYLLSRDASRRLARLGDALFSVKRTHFSINDTKFGLFGDPTLRLKAPLYRAQIDSINGKPTTSLAEVRALEKVTVQGSILKLDGSLWSDYSGKLLIIVYDSRKRVPIPEWFDFSFTIPGGLIFRGENTIKNGKFSSSFFVPKDILYENDRGRIAVYFSNQASDGTGYTENILIGGTDSTAVDDREGPRMSIYLDSRTFRPGDVVSESPLLIVDYFDEHGVNTASGGIGHRLEARIDDQATPIDLTNFYKGKTDSYKEGTVEYPLSGLTEGKHVVRAKAWDVYNNSSMAEVAFEVATSTNLRVMNVFNYPNPFSGATTFTFQQNLSVPLDVEIKIYTLTGRLIRILRSAGVSERFVRIPWDGRDEDGDELANGTYLYRVIARAVDGNSSTEVMGKLSVLK